MKLKETSLRSAWPAYPPAKQPEGAARRGALNAEATPFAPISFT